MLKLTSVRHDVASLALSQNAMALLPLPSLAILARRFGRLLGVSRGPLPHESEAQSGLEKGAGPIHARQLSVLI